MDFRQVLELPQKVVAGIERLWNNRYKLALGAMFAIGLLLVLFGSARFEGTLLVAILVLAGLFMAIPVAWMFIDSIRQQERIKIDAERLRQEVDELHQDRDRLRETLDAERSKPVKVLNIQPILDISVLEADCEIIRFFDRWYNQEGKLMSDSEKASLAEKNERPVKRFIGALTARFKAKYGIEFHKVQVCDDAETRTLCVLGAQPGFRGISAYPQSNWEGCLGLVAGVWGWNDDVKFEGEMKQKLREEMDTGLMNGPEQLEWVKKPLTQNIQRLFETMFAPPGYQVKLLEATEGAGDKRFLPFWEYLQRREDGEQTIRLQLK